MKTDASITMDSLHQQGTRRSQRGAVAIMLGLTLVLLIAFVGLAIDFGRFFVIKSELQNAVDACALAAASQLRPGQNNPNTLTKAVAYGRLMATGGTGGIAAIRNRANFGSEVVEISAAQVTFSATAGGVYQDASSANYDTANYARCSYPLSGLPVYFLQVLDSRFSRITVSATAVATLAPSSSACAIPVGVCMASGGTATNTYGLSPGQWLTAKTSSPYGTGNFGWVDFTPPNGGASELADLLTGSGQCDLKVGALVGEQGNKASLDLAWNSRFGWYRQGGGQPSLTNAPPDFTGYAYSKDRNWPGGSNAYAGTSTVPGALNFAAARTAHEPYQGDTPLGIPGNGYTASSRAQHQSAGRNRRIAVAPVLDCSVWNVSGNAQPAVQDWACVLMLNPFSSSGTPKNGEVWDTPVVEFLGLSTTPGSPCATGGEPGTFGPRVPVLAQ